MCPTCNETTTSAAQVNRKQTCTQITGITDVADEKKKKSRATAGKGRNHLSHSGHFHHCLHPPPFLLTRIIFPFRCNLPTSSRLLFPVLFFSLFSVPLSACIWWYQCSRTPPLTDNSLDGTLLCTVQRTASLPQ